MIYPIKILSQLSPIIKGFRKEKGYTQAAIAKRLGITQQSYAYFEANPASATMERLYTVLRLLDVEIALHQTYAYSDRQQISMEVAQFPAVYNVDKVKPPISKKTSRKVASKQSAKNTKSSTPTKVSSKARKESW